MEIMLGSLCYKIALYIRKIRWTVFAKFIFALVEFGGYASSVVYMYSTLNTKFDWWILLFLAVSITVTFSDISSFSFINRLRYVDSVLHRGGKYSYSLFLGHWMWAKHFNLFFSSYNWREKVVCYFLLSFLTGIGIMYISYIISFLWKRNGSKLKGLLIKT